MDIFNHMPLLEVWFEPYHFKRIILSAFELNAIIVLKYKKFIEGVE